MDVIRYHPHLDAEAIHTFGQLSFNISDMYLLERYGIATSDQWLHIFQNYWSFTIYLSIIYVIAMATGKRLMALRRPFELRKIMISWNMSIALISSFGAIRTASVIYGTWANYGFKYAVCHPHYYYNKSNFWGILFVLSKPLELIDTIFIVLRKQNLIFLHWYHHMTVMVYVVLSVASHSVPAICFCCLNFCVHSMMYSYYVLKSLKVFLPRFLPIIVTGAQILQMMTGMAILFYVVYLRINSKFCQISNSVLNLGIFLYTSYFVFFIRFFYQSYYKGEFWKARIVVKLNDKLSDKIK